MKKKSDIGPLMEHCVNAALIYQVKTAVNMSLLSNLLYKAII